MSELQYEAFISYRHKELDIAVAKALHLRIETYGIPGYIKKKTGKQKMGKVFRDQDELPLLADLGEGIHRALEASEWLIVICSPDLPQSKWCMAEIDYFIELGRRDHILTVLISGEPEESFPQQLRFADGVEREPLAADIRANTQAAVLKKLRQEKLRLLAPMLGVGYDDLRRRQRERFLRTVAGVSAAVAVAATGSGAYVLTQNRLLDEQRAIAQQQRDEALAAQSRSLAAKAMEQLETGDVTAASLLALQALPRDLENPEKPLTPEAEDALRSIATYADCGIYRPMARLGTSHSFDASLAVAISPDGSLFALSGKEGYAATGLYDTQSLRMIVQLPVPREQITVHGGEAGGSLSISGPVFSTDSQKLLVCGGSLPVIDTGTGEVLFYLDSTTTQGLEEFGLVEDSYEPESGEPLMPAGIGSYDASRCGPSPDGNYYVSVRSVPERQEQPDGSVINMQSWITAVTALPSGEIVFQDTRVFPAANTPWALTKTRGGAGVRFSGDSRRMLLEVDDQTVAVVDLETGACLPELGGHENSVIHASLNADGTRVAATTEDRILVWDADTGELLDTLLGDGRFMSAFFAGERTILALCGNLSLDTFSCQVWQESASPFALRMETPPQEPDPYDANGEKTLGFYPELPTLSPDGDFVLAKFRHMAYIWEAETGQWLRTVEIGSPYQSPPVLLYAEKLEDGRQVVRSEAEDSLIVDIASGEIIPREEYDAKMETKQPFSGWMIRADDGQIAINERKPGAPLSEPVTILEYSGSGSLPCAIHPEGAFAAVFNPRQAVIEILDPQTGDSICSLDADRRPVNHLVLSPDGFRLLATSLSGGMVRMYDTSDWSILYTVYDPSCGGETPRFSADGSVIQTKVSVRDAATGARLLKVGGVLHSNGIAPTPLDRLLLAQARDYDLPHEVVLYRIPAMEEIFDNLYPLTLEREFTLEDRLELGID